MTGEFEFMTGGSDLFKCLIRFTVTPTRTHSSRHGYDQKNSPLRGANIGS